MRPILVFVFAGLALGMCLAFGLVQNGVIPWLLGICGAIICLELAGRNLSNRAMFGLLAATLAAAFIIGARNWGAPGFHDMVAGMAAGGFGWILARLVASSLQSEPRAV